MNFYIAEMVELTKDRYYYRGGALAPNTARPKH